MSSASRRIALALAATVLLAGCGFHPMYGGGSDDAVADAALAGIRVEPIPNRIGQLVANELRDSFNPRGAAVPARYNLKVIVSAANSDLAIRTDGTASRELYVATANFSLLPIDGHGPGLGGSARSNNSYDIGENEYSVVVANDDAQTRAARDIAQQISLQLSLFMQQQAAKQ
jgi:LPS-assembly lipoprotein